MEERNVKLAIVTEFVSQFNQNGPKVTLDSVCKPIHISKKTIYKYFPSKAGIYDYILEEAVKAVLEGQKAVYEDPNLSTKEKLVRILNIRTDWESKIDVSKIFEFETYEPAFYAKFLKAYESNWDYFLSLMDKGKRDGTVKPEANPDIVVALLSSAMVSLYKGDALQRLGLSYQEAIDQIAGTVLFGILA
jgi:AcrR family transcriptional regulator